MNRAKRLECVRLAGALMTHGMWTLAARIAPWPAGHYIPESEIKE
jgi:hypothetical protein